MRSVSLPSFAKINLDLRVLGTRPDGYHDLRTVFQSLALFDNVTVTRAARSVRRSPATSRTSRPIGATWCGRRRRCCIASRPARHRAPRDIAIDLRKRVPSEAGLGGGSANAAMTLLALNKLWKLDLDLADADAHRRAARRRRAVLPGRRHRARTRARRRHLSARRHAAGARRDPAARFRRRHRPTPTTWFDEELAARPREPAPRVDARPAGRPGRPRCATISRFRSSATIPRSAASASRSSMPAPTFAAMSGSGSAVFGLFERADAARTNRERPGAARAGCRFTPAR